MTCSSSVPRNSACNAHSDAIVLLALGNAQQGMHACMHGSGGRRQSFHT
jgi:hypothetical protein